MVQVGFDVDGVLRDLAPHVVRVYKELYPKFGSFFVDPSEVNFYDHRKNMDPFDEDVFGHFRNHTLDSTNKNVIRKIFSEAPIYEEAQRRYSRCYDMLNQIGCEVTICTHQTNTLRIMATLKWLRDNNISFDGCIFTKRGNKDAYGVDYLIDDKPENIIRNESVGNVGVLMRRAWNKNDLSRVKHHVDNLMDFTKLIIKQEGYNA